VLNIDVIKSQKEVYDKNRQLEDNKTNEVSPENSIAESFSSNQSLFNKLEECVVTSQNDLATIPTTHILIIHFELIQMKMEKHPVRIMGTNVVLLDNLENTHSLQKIVSGDQLN